MLLPPRGQTEMSIDRSFTWEQVRDLPAERQPRGAYYTVRNHRPEADEIDIDVVLHGDDGDASAWAARAQPGDVAALWGPRTSWEPDEQTVWYLLVADETGLPAVGRGRGPVSIGPVAVGPGVRMGWWREPRDEH